MASERTQYVSWLEELTVKSCERLRPAPCLEPTIMPLILQRVVVTLITPFAAPLKGGHIKLRL